MNRRCEVVRRRGLSEQDIAVWGAFAQQVQPLPGRSLPAPAPAPEPPANLRRDHASPPPRRMLSRPGSLVIGEQPPGVDNATWRRLQTGKLPSERSLDLHGHTAQRAYVALELLLHGASADGVRVVQIITGHGSSESGGLLKREVPLWLNLPHLRPMILAAAYAHTRNTGAIRLLLRRKKGLLF